MTKNNLIFSLFCFLLVGCSEPKKTDVKKYEELITKAEIDFENGEYQKSLENFKNSFNIFPYKKKQDYLFAAAAAFHLKKDKKATDLIISVIKNMNVYEYDLLNFTEFQPFMNNDFFTHIRQTFPSLLKQIKSVSKSPQIDKEIDSLIAEDQRVRKGWREIEKLTKNEKITRIKEMKRVDCLNINRIIEITKEFGWHPKMRIILWHHRGIHKDDNYVWNYFRPFINEQIKIGNIKKSFWARYEDNKSMDENGTQIYGMYSGQSDRFPIVDIANLDIRRKEMGLPPLWYNFLMFKNKLAREYKNTLANNHYGNNYSKIKL